jgi:multidrug resistance efflux pump
VQQAQANMQNVERESQRRQELTSLAVTKEEKQTYASNAVVAQAQYQQAVANLDQARVNLQRTEIRSPVNGWVTNLLAQLGDYANVGQNEILSSTPTRSGSTAISRRRTSSRSRWATRPRSS